MKISQITINDLLGVRQIDAHLVSPVNYFMGRNGAGKSSIKEAVKMALLGSPDRVALKKEYGEIVHAGAKGGSVSVETEKNGTAGFVAPKGTHSGAENVDQTALPYCLEPRLFAALEQKEKRSFLMGLMGARPDREKIAARLAELVVTEQVVEFVLPMLRQGFPAAAAQAEQQRKDARAAWKAVTGETYGEVKAETWKAEAPAHDQGRIEEIAAAISTQSQQLEDMVGKLGGLRQEKTQVVMVTNTRQKWEAEAGRLPAAKRKLETDIQNRDAAQAAFEDAATKAGTGKREGLVHDLARAVSYLMGDFDPNQSTTEELQAESALADYIDRYGPLDQAEGDPEAAAKLPELEKAFQLMQRAVENAERDLRVAQVAADTLQAEEARAMRSAETIDTEIAGLEATISKEKQHIADYQAQLRAEEDVKRKFLESGAITKKAADYHAQALAWDKAYAALSPDGIPAELLASALEPFNASMKAVSIEFDWPQVCIDGDMLVTSGGRAYRLLSESEQWRTDTIIAIAISYLAGIHFVMLDRFDVLDAKGRNDAIDGLDRLAEQQIIESALVMGTVKAKPDLSQFDQSAVFWIEEGKVLAEKSDVRKAA